MNESKKITNKKKRLLISSVAVMLLVAVILAFTANFANAQGFQFGSTIFSSVAQNEESQANSVTESDADNDLSAEAGVIKVYRMYRHESGEHLFTTSEEEYNYCGTLLDGQSNPNVREGYESWKQEEDAWEALDDTYGTVGVYRLYCPGLGAQNRMSHHYTASKAEAEGLVKTGEWQYDNDGNPIFYSDADFEAGNKEKQVPREGAIDVYRLYCDNISSHHFTTSKEENDWLLGLPNDGWTSEDVSFYAYTKVTKPNESTVDDKGQTQVDDPATEKQDKDNPTEADPYLNVTVTYKQSADDEDSYKVADGAKIAVAENGSITVTMPKDKAGCDVRVLVQSVVNSKVSPATYRDVTLVDSTSDTETKTRATKPTGDDGMVTFKAERTSEDTVDSGGKVEIPDPITDKEDPDSETEEDPYLSVTVTYKGVDEDDDAYKPAKGAIVSISEEDTDKGYITVTMPKEKAGSVVKVQVQSIVNSKAPVAVKGRVVTLYDKTSDTETKDRGTQTTGEDGFVTFTVSKTESDTTGSDGTGEVINPDVSKGDKEDPGTGSEEDPYFKVTVSYKLTPDDTAFLPAKGAKIDVSTEGETKGQITVTMPKDKIGCVVQVMVENVNGTTITKAQDKKVILYDTATDGSLTARGWRNTGEDGTALFDVERGANGTTGDNGQGSAKDPSLTPDTDPDNPDSGSGDDNPAVADPYVEVKVEYKDSESDTYKPASGATFVVKLDANEKGIINVTMPKNLSNKYVQVTVNEVVSGKKTPAEGRYVQLYENDNTNRGERTTTNGVVTFTPLYTNNGSTGKDGTAEVSDPTKDDDPSIPTDEKAHLKVYVDYVEYKTLESGVTEAIYNPVPAATVESDSKTKAIKVKMPADKVNKDVRVTVKSIKGETEEIKSGITVDLYEAGTQVARDSKATDLKGEALFIYKSSSDSQSFTVAFVTDSGSDTSAATTISNMTVKRGEYFTVNPPTCTNKVFKYWRVSSLQGDRFDPETDYITEDKCEYDKNTKTYKMTLYAEWDTVEKGAYWIATGGSTDPSNPQKDENYKSQEQLQKDMAAINNTSDWNHDEVVNEYKQYMQDDKVRLYCTYGDSDTDWTDWAYTSVTTGEPMVSQGNKYLEFRIINVGSHVYNSNGDNDGSTLTFMSTSFLPEGQKFYDSLSANNTTSSGGWSGSKCTLYTALNLNGSISNKIGVYSSAGNSINLAEKAVPVKKATCTGPYQETVKTDSGTPLFVLSYEEVMGSNLEWTGEANAEGEQYQFFTSDYQDVRADKSNNSCLSLRTRAGNYWYDSDLEDGFAYWTTRTCADDDNGIIYLNESGYGSADPTNDYKTGVAIAFAF
jgi:hypothetical protein